MSRKYYVVSYLGLYSSVIVTFGLTFLIAYIFYTKTADCFFSSLNALHYSSIITLAGGFNILLLFLIVLAFCYLLLIPLTVFLLLNFTNHRTKALKISINLFLLLLPAPIASILVIALIKNNTNYNEVNLELLYDAIFVIIWANLAVFLANKFSKQRREDIIS